MLQIYYLETMQELRKDVPPKFADGLLVGKWHESNGVRIDTADWLSCRICCLWVEPYGRRKGSKNLGTLGPASLLVVIVMFLNAGLGPQCSALNKHIYENTGLK